MEPVNKILICLQDPDETAGLLSYATLLAAIDGDAELHLLHVRSPEPAAPGSGAPPSPLGPDELRGWAEAAGPDIDRYRWRAEVLEGSRLVEILRYAMDNEIDLILLGRAGPAETERPRRGTLARRVTAKATCSVLLVPRGAASGGRRIIVPVRNSPCSAMALATACRIAGQTGGAVCALNVFAVHGNYLKMGATLEEHTALMRQWAERECEELLRSVADSKVQVTTRCEPDLYLDPVPIILSHVRHSEADLVVIGARGRTGAAGVLLGTVTEQLMQDCPVPVLAVKKKGECLGVLRALLSLAG